MRSVLVAAALSSSCFGQAGSVPSASGEFLLKDIAFFGVTLWLLADAIDAARKQATLAT
jgi:hypothetical protein